LIGRGLHYHHYKERFEGRVVIEIVYIPLKDEGRMGYRELVVDEMEKELSGTKIEGNNPAVFQWTLGQKIRQVQVVAKCFFTGTYPYFWRLFRKEHPKLLQYMT
jgi:hypothetical protein